MTGSPRDRFRRALWALSAIVAIGLAGCGEPSDKRAEEEAAAEPPREAETPALGLEPVAFADLPGWSEDDFAGAFDAFAKSCAQFARQPQDRGVGTEALALRVSDFADACGSLPAQAADPAEARAYFETHFTPFLAIDARDGTERGLFTGYFEAELSGARRRDATYDTPLYAVPEDLVVADLGRFSEELAGKRVVGRVEDGRFVPYPERGEIESGLLAERGLELLWIDDPVDVFLLQVQGSGRVVLPDGEVVRVGFAGHNGRPYRSIGRVLIERGAIEPHAASWDGIRGWIEENPDEAHALFAENPRFVFFREIDGAADGPIGAQGVPLTPRRSLAVDRSLVPLGLPVWLDTTRPGDSDVPLRRLMVAQDTGGAITGPVRGDFFWGYGETALAEAGRMKSRGRYFLLLPNPAAARLAAPGT